MELNDNHRQVLRHTLTGSSGTDEVYRNYFAAAPGHHDWETLNQLVAGGLMYVGRAVHGTGKSTYFHCTAEGAGAVGLVFQQPWATQQRQARKSAE